MQPCAAMKASTRCAPRRSRGRSSQHLLPSLSILPGFRGYYLIDAGEGVFASVSLFESAKEAHESTRVAARWVREQKLEDALPNTPKITAGPVSAHQSPAASAVANGVPALA